MNIESTELSIIKDYVIPIITIVVSIVLAYLSTKWTIRNQYRLGKYQLFEITNRYFITAFNGLDISTPVFKTKASSIEKKYQLNEIKAIHNDMAKLIDNPYFIGLLKDYPEFAMIKIRLRREITDLENARVVTLNPDNVDIFYKLYLKIKNDIPKRVLKKNETFSGIDGLVNELNQRMEPHKTKQP